MPVGHPVRPLELDSRMAMARQLSQFSALLVSAFVMFMAIGLANILIPVRTSIEGWPTTTLGYIGTANAIAFTGACFFLPTAIRRVGHIRCFAAFQTLLGCSILLNGLFVHELAWVCIRFLAGGAAAGSYMILESWLNEQTDNAQRGLILSVYMIISMVGMLAGQYLLPVGDPSTNQLFMAVALLFGAALLPMTLSVITTPAPPQQASLDLRGLIHRSPVAVVAAFLSGTLFGSWHYFAPSYAQQVGLSNVAVSTMLGAAMIGGMLFQFPIGRLSDVIDRRMVMVIIGGAGMVFSATFYVLQPDTIWFVATATFLIGGALFPTYAVAVAHANDYASAEDFISVSGGLLITYGIGNAVGPQVAGRVMDLMGPQGFFVTLGISFGCYGLYAFYRTTQRMPITPAAREDFQVIPVTPFQTPNVYQLDPRTEPIANDMEAGDIVYEAQLHENEDDESTAMAG